MPELQVGRSSDTQDASVVPHVTEAYQQARKGYVLSAALLMAWELIGINLKDTPYFELVTPEAAPLVLLAATLYFAVRLTLEWMQTDSRRQAHMAARLDFWLAHAIGATAAALYVVQLALQIQLAPLLLTPNFVAASLALIAGASTVWLVAFVRSRWQDPRLRGPLVRDKAGRLVLPEWFNQLLGLFTTSVGTVAGAVMLTNRDDGWSSSIVWTAIGAGIGFATYWVSQRGGVKLAWARASSKDRTS